MKLSPATRTALSISLATGLYGVSFGALGVTSGLSALQTMCLSLLMFTGGSQFAFIGAVGAGGGPALLAASLMGVRNAVYGAHMNAMFRPRGWRRPLMAQITIDESTATAIGQETPDEQRRGFWVAGIGVYLTWNLFTAVGALLGNKLGDPRTYGLDGAAVAAFLALLWPRLKSKDAVATAVLAALVTAICVPTLPAGIPLIVAAVVTAVMTLWRGRSADAPGDTSTAAETHERTAPDLDAAPGTANHITAHQTTDHHTTHHHTTHHHTTDHHTTDHHAAEPPTNGEPSDGVHTTAGEPEVGDSRHGGLS